MIEVTKIFNCGPLDDNTMTYDESLVDNGCYYSVDGECVVVLSLMDQFSYV